MWKQRRFLVGTVLLAALFVAESVLAQTPRRLGRRARMWERPEVREELGLTDEQVRELKTWFYEAAKIRMDLRSQIQLMELELERLLDAVEPNAETIQAKAREIGELRAQQYQDRVADRLALKQILSPEQQQKLGEIVLRAREARERRPERLREPRRPRGDRREPSQEPKPENNTL